MTQSNDEDAKKRKEEEERREKERKEFQETVNRTVRDMGSILSF